MAPSIHSMKVPVKLGLAELIEAKIENIEGVKFEYAFSTEAASVRTVTLGVARSIEQEVPGFKAGRKRRDEHWEQEIWIEVDDPSLSTAQACDQAAHELYNVIGDLLADKPNLNIEGLAWGDLTDDEISGPFPKSNGWLVRRRCKVEFFAQLI